MRTLRLLSAAAFGLATGDGVTQSPGDQPTVEPYTIAVPDTVLDDLDERLARTRWPDQLADTEWAYGADTAYIRELAEYWRRSFDWRAHEDRLNELEHFRARVDGMRVHFVHAKSSDPGAIPLLMLHGWPSTFVQMLDIIPLLTDPAAHGLPSEPSFHVVAASLPGFGFSDVPTRPGVG
ncbi:MAG: epoxide hydrolase N-terminal domain-containing protein, partial [Gammaproteobacteria bacterium]|nr:epoxide hydrolase N-terminal domain-containing protein [Gammaproteobacteria bacterium]